MPSSQAQHRAPTNRPAAPTAEPSSNDLRGDCSRFLHPFIRVNRVIGVIKVIRVLGFRVPKVLLGYRIIGYRVFRDIRVIRVIREIRVIRDIKVIRVIRVILGL
jgi:hypothetical protein